MKKSILIASILAMFATSAFACGNGGCGSDNNLGTATSSVTSSVSGGVYSSSTVTNANGYSVHGAASTASNTTCVTGDQYSKVGSAGATTAAGTIGYTVVVAGGIGSGDAQAAANQSGHGTITETGVATDTRRNKIGSASATSSVGVSTSSYVDSVDTGLLAAANIGGALNITNTNVGLDNCTGGCSNANGISVGIDGVLTAGSTLPTGSENTVTSVGQSAESGSYTSTITK